MVGLTVMVCQAVVSLDGLTVEGWKLLACAIQLNVGACFLLTCFSRPYKNETRPPKRNPNPTRIP